MKNVNLEIPVEIVFIDSGQKIVTKVWGKNEGKRNEEKENEE